MTSVKLQLYKKNQTTTINQTSSIDFRLSLILKNVNFNQFLIRVSVRNHTSLEKNIVNRINFEIEAKSNLF